LEVSMAKAALFIVLAGVFSDAIARCGKEGDL
jgi:hypothetical protein